jgi:hypothetical protein
MQGAAKDSVSKDALPHVTPFRCRRHARKIAGPPAHRDMAVDTGRGLEYRTIGRHGRRRPVIAGPPAPD